MSRLRTCVARLLATLALGLAVTSALAAGPALALSDNEVVLARELRAHGFGNIQIAALIGNTVGESGCDPTIDYELSGMFNWPYEWGCGLFGYTDCGYAPDQLVLTHRTQLKEWAAAHGWDWATTEAQVEFTFGDSGGLSWRADWMTGLAENGYYWGYSGVPVGMAYDATPDEFLAETSLEVATYSWMACYGRGAAAPNHYADGLNLENSGRLGEAYRVLADLESGQYEGVISQGRGQIPAAQPSVLALDGIASPSSPLVVAKRTVRYHPLNDVDGLAERDVHAYAQPSQAGGVPAKALATALRQPTQAGGASVGEESDSTPQLVIVLVAAAALAALAFGLDRARRSERLPEALRRRLGAKVDDGGDASGAEGGDASGADGAAGASGEAPAPATADASAVAPHAGLPAPVAALAEAVKSFSHKMLGKERRAWPPRPEGSD